MISTWTKKELHWPVSLRYMAVLLLAAAAIGSLSLLPGREGIQRIFGALQQMAFVALGCVHTFYGVRWLPFFRNRDDSVPVEGWRFTGLLSLEIAGCLSILYALTDKGGIATALAAACLFLLPFVLRQSWAAFAAIPAKRYKIWFNPLVLPGKAPFPSLSNFHLRIRMTRNYYDIADVVIETVTPVRMRLGKIFFHFVLEQNLVDGPGIEWLDEKGLSYGWEFFAGRMGGVLKRRLDPDLNLTDNKIKQNDIILARRVSRMKTIHS